MSTGGFYMVKIISSIGCLADFMLVYTFTYIWFGTVQVSDRREYARYLKNTDLVKRAVYHTPNDMYKSPITKFENPMFGKAV